MDNLNSLADITNSTSSNLIDEEDNQNDVQNTSDSSNNNSESLYDSSTETSLGTIIEAQNTEAVVSSESIQQQADSTSEQIEQNMQSVEQLGCGCSSCCGQASGLIIEGTNNSTENGLTASAVGDGDFDYGDAVAGWLGSEANASTLLTGNEWGPGGGTAASITYSFLDSVPSYYPGGATEQTDFQTFTAGQEAAVREIFDMLESFANLTFTEVAAQDGEITFGQAQLDPGAGAWAYYPDQGDFSGDVWTNTTYDASAENVTKGQWGFSMHMHEIGHALGLQHTFSAGLTGAEDTDQFSVMAYNGGGWGGLHPTGYQLYDISALQAIYGANTTHNTGNDTYTLGLNQAWSLWDAGGTDTLDASALNTNNTIYLEDGVLSDIGGLSSNFSIAYNAVIENATGGSGNDNIYGNDVANTILGGNGDDVLFGSAGNDTLNGGANNDTVNYSATAASMAFNFIDSVTVQIQNTVGGVWTDFVTNVENFIFTDGTYTFAELEAAFAPEVNDFAPTASANDLTLNIDEIVLASTVITAADVDGNALTYEVWDSGKSTTSGYFELNGNKLSAGNGHTLTQAEFDNLNIVGGDTNGEDLLWLRVSDGVHTTAWNMFTLTTQASGAQVNDFAPTVTANNLTLGNQATALASSVITANDADGNDLTYTIWDSGNGTDSGYFELNGNAFSTGMGHDLTQAEFDNLNIVGGNSDGNETLWIKVSDSAHSTAWTSFTLTTATGGGGGGVVNNFAPTLSTNNLSIDQAASILASTVITANDADGNDLTYTLWDGGSGGGSGYFELGGSALAAKTSHTLTQAEFDTLNIVGGNAEGSETLWVKVSDGANTTAWSTFTLSTNSAGGANYNAPTVVVNDQTLNGGQTILASTAINVNDADGNDITYIVWDGGTGSNSGYFELGGNALTAGQGHTLTQAEFDALNIVGGASGTETLWVYVTDGKYTTQWESFTLTNLGGGAANNAPTATANDLTLGSGASVLASSTITVNDLDGDNLSYTVWDSGKANSSGYFELGGNRLSAGGGHNLTQAEFDTLRIVGGSLNGQDTLWVKVSDGQESTAWIDFYLTTDMALMPPPPPASDIIDTGDDDLAAALEDLSASSGESNGDSTAVSSGDVFSGVSGFEENTDTSII